MNVREFLEKRDVPFEVLPHWPTYDAQHTAQAVHVPGREMAKTVLLRVDGPQPFVVAVLPATRHIDFARVKYVLGLERVSLANERDISEQCPDCEFGVLPPFGSQYGMTTLVDAGLSKDDQIVFNGNTHEEAIRMKYNDFCRIEHPTVASFACGA